MRHFLLFAGFLLLISCNEEPKPKTDFVRLKGDFVSHMRVPFYYLNDSIDFRKIKIDCDCNYYYTDSAVFVNSKHGKPVVMEFDNHIQTFLPDTNPAFNPYWEYLEVGERPTPLTQKQVWAYDEFMSLRLLNEYAPAFSIENGVNHDDLLGKITVINFWYYGCVPCMAEIPALNSVKETYAENDKVQFWAFSADRELKGHENFNFEHYLASEEIRSKFGVPAFPNTFIIDGQGVIRVINLGAQEGKNESISMNLKIRIDDLLGEELEVIKD